MGFATRAAKSWQEVPQVGRALTEELEGAKIRLNLECARILPAKTWGAGKAVVVAVPIDCSECENPTSAEVEILLAIR
ncbi:hypothetical protein ACFPNZ_31745 [Microvirga aerilata]